MIAQSFFRIGNVYYSIGNKERGLEYYIKSLEIFKQINDLEGIAGSLSQIAFDYWVKGNTRQVIFYFEKSYSLYKKIDDKFGMAKQLNGIGRNYFQLGSINKALDYQKRSLAINKKISHNIAAIGVNWQCIGGVYHFMGNNNKALECYNKSLIIAEKIFDYYSVAMITKDIGINYFSIGNYEKSLQYLNKAILIQKKIEKDEFSNRIELESIIYLNYIYKHQGKKYKKNEILSNLKDAKNINFRINLQIFQLLEEELYLEKAYNEVQEKADNLEPDVAAKFLSYPIPKAIVEEWEKIN